MIQQWAAQAEQRGFYSPLQAEHTWESQEQGSSAEPAMVHAWQTTVSNTLGQCSSEPRQLTRTQEYRSKPRCSSFLQKLPAAPTKGPQPFELMRFGFVPDYVGGDQQ